MQMDADRHRLNSAISSALELLEKAVIPLFEDFKGKPAVVGTGLLVRYRSHVFLLSAAHVLLQLRHKNIYYFSESGAIKHITGKITTNSYIGDRRKDNVDIGVVRLENDPLIYPSVNKYAINSSIFRFGEIASPTARYALIGYPASKLKVLMHPVQILIEPYAYLAHSAPTHEYSNHGISTASHLYLVFDRRHSCDLAGNSRAFPKPHGISGSPVFILYDFNESSEDKHPDYFTFAGLITTWKPKESRLIATSVNLVLDLLQNAA